MKDQIQSKNNKYVLRSPSRLANGKNTHTELGTRGADTTFQLQLKPYMFFLIFFHIEIITSTVFSLIKN